MTKSESSWVELTVTHKVESTSVTHMSSSTNESQSERLCLERGGDTGLVWWVYSKFFTQDDEEDRCQLLSCCCGRVPCKSKLRKKFISVIVRKLSLWGRCGGRSTRKPVTRHKSTVRKQRAMSVHAPLAFSFVSSRGLQGPHPGWFFPLLLNITGNTLLETPRSFRGDSESYQLDEGGWPP